MTGRPERGPQREQRAASVDSLGTVPVGTFGLAAPQHWRARHAHRYESTQSRDYAVK